VKIDSMQASRKGGRRRFIKRFAWLRPGKRHDPPSCQSYNNTTSPGLPNADGQFVKLRHHTALDRSSVLVKPTNVCRYGVSAYLPSPRRHLQILHT
jgi:hypothetical protein